MRPLNHWLFLLLFVVLMPLSVQGQQFMLPPPNQILTEPPPIKIPSGRLTGDQEAKLWLTFQRRGIYLDGDQIRPYYDTSKIQQDHYRGLRFTDGGRIWLTQARLGLSSRIVLLDPISHRTEPLPDKSQLVRSYLNKYEINGLSANHRGQLLISLKENGFLLVNPQTLAVDHLFNEKVTVSYLSEGPDGRLWFATPQGLCAFNPQTRQSRYYRHDPNQPASISSNEIETLRVRENGDVLISFFNEIDILTPRTGQVRKILLPLPTPVSRMWTDTFVPDRFGNDYFSVGLMVCRITPAGELQRIDFPFPAEKIRSIFIQRGQSDLLWVNAGNRLYQYDLSRLRPMPLFNILDVDVNGTRLITNEHTREERFQRDTTGQAFLTIQDGDFVHVRFTSYAAMKESRFRYKLEGYDQQWASFSDFLGDATYQLSAGRYSFLFNLAGPGEWDPKPASLIIIVKPIFWKTVWFRLLVLAILAGLAFWLIRAARRRQKLRQELARREGEAANLRQLDEFKSNFFANVTHEFRTPLTIILNATEQLVDTPLNQRQQDRLESIQRNANQLLMLVNETLDMAKLDAGKLDFNAHLGDPVAFVEQVVDQFNGLAEQKGIDLKWIVEGRSDELMYLFDDKKLEKIVYNLLANALKFTPAGGQVSVTCQTTHAHRFVLQVSDTGIGIPANQLTRIFERFYQLDASSTRAYSGTGIGLALVKELTEWLGGRVVVESEVGKGSIFTIDIPLTKQAVTNSQSLMAQTSLTTAAFDQKSAESIENGLVPALDDGLSGKPLVLIVEDNAEMRTYVADYLSAYYQVLTAATGRQGLDEAIRQVPDLIVSDVMMPELDGYELAERLKSDARTSHIPLVLLTARSSYDSRMKGLGAGADDYLAKPFSLAELNLRIRNCLKTRENWQQRLMLPATAAVSKPTPEPRLDREQQFLDRLRQLILDNMGTETVDVDWLATHAGMSRTQLYRKLIALTTLSTNRFIHQVRLEKATELLQIGDLNVAEVAYQVGYNSQSYFTKVFQEHFGYAPSKIKA